jgi:hypothetical protein
MSRYATSISTPMSAADAFAYLADVNHFSEWDPSVIRAVQVVGTGPGVGSTYDLTVKAIGTTTMRYRVSKLEAPRHLVIVSRTPMLNSVDEIRVDSVGSGAIVTYDAKLTLNRGAALFDPLLQRFFNQLGRRAAEGLRRALGGTLLVQATSPRPSAPRPATSSS